MTLAPRARQLLNVIALLISTVRISQCADWNQYKSAHFELLTEAPPADARQALVQLELAQRYFEGSSLWSLKIGERVRLVAFQSPAEYRRFSLSPEAFAHYLNAAGRDYIVLQDIQADHCLALVHEFTHYVVHQAKYKLPMWLNEGIADYYSSLCSRAEAGAILQERVATLNGGGWIPLSLLVAANSKSLHTTGTTDLPLFYAEGWALTHMLMTDPAYAPRFRDLMYKTASGMTTADAIGAVYQRSLAQIEQDLHQSIGCMEVRKSVRIQPQTESGTVIQVQSISQFSSDLALATLLAAQSWTAREGEDWLVRLRSSYPQSADPEEALGWLAVRHKDLASAREHLSRAVELGSKDANVISRLAMLEQTGGAPQSRIAPFRFTN